jgi:hypothetical protein
MEIWRPRFGSKRVISAILSDSFPLSEATRYNRAHIPVTSKMANRGVKRTPLPFGGYAPARRLTTSLNWAVSVYCWKWAILPPLNLNTCTNWAFTLTPVAL